MRRRGGGTCNTGAAEKLATRNIHAGFTLGHRLLHILFCGTIERPVLLLWNDNRMSRRES